MTGVESAGASNESKQFYTFTVKNGLVPIIQLQENKGQTKNETAKKIKTFHPPKKQTEEGKVISDLNRETHSKIQRDEVPIHEVPVFTDLHNVGFDVDTIDLGSIDNPPNDIVATILLEEDQTVTDLPQLNIDTATLFSNDSFFNIEDNTNLDINSLPTDILNTLNIHTDVVQEEALNEGPTYFNQLKSPSDGGYVSAGSLEDLPSDSISPSLYTKSSAEFPTILDQIPNFIEHDEEQPEFQRIATFDDTEQLEDFIFAKKSKAPPKFKKSARARNNKREIELEARKKPIEKKTEAQKNMERCRTYRENRKKKLTINEIELEKQEKRHKMLHKKFTDLTTKVEKLREYYLFAIKNGSYKCCKH